MDFFRLTNQALEVLSSLFFDAFYLYFCTIFLLLWLNTFPS